MGVDLKEQAALISFVASSRELMALTSGILKPSYFDPALKKTVKFMTEYFTQYRDVPKLELIRAKTDYALDPVGQVGKADIRFVSEQLENFCRNQAVTEAILKGPELLDKGDMTAIITELKSAISLGLHRDLGTDYFKDPELRIKSSSEEAVRISTLIPELDLFLGGGLARQEILIFAGGSGVGKSMNMLNLAHNLLIQGYNGVYFSLEMSQKLVSRRLDSMVSRVSQQNIDGSVDKVAAAIHSLGTTSGRFFIKRLAENRTNANHLRAYLEQLEQETGITPDFIVLDYIDITGTTMNVSPENLFVKDKFVTEEVRAIGLDYDAMMISASQLGRSSWEAEKLTQANIQGGLSKIQTGDCVVAIRQDDLMKARNEIEYTALKARNSTCAGQSVTLAWDPISLKVSSMGSELSIKKKPTSDILQSVATRKKDSVLNLLQTTGASS
jgi:archaellum biogenesis ATPase FlaH